MTVFYDIKNRARKPAIFAKNQAVQQQIKSVTYADKKHDGKRVVRNLNSDIVNVFCRHACTEALVNNTLSNKITTPCRPFLKIPLKKRFYASIFKIFNWQTPTGV